MIRDELRYAVRNELFVDVSRDTLTFRNTPGQQALPMRRLGSFLPGEGVGGAGVHWNGQTYRLSPHDHALRSRVEERYGKSFIPQDMQPADWPMSYAELEPHYDRFERRRHLRESRQYRWPDCGGRQSFRGAACAEYPNPRSSRARQRNVHGDDEEARYHPFPRPAANMSRPYTNPDGIQLGCECQYCGFCENFGCEANAKASPHITVIPAASSQQELFP